MIERQVSLDSKSVKIPYINPSDFADSGGYVSGKYQNDNIEMGIGGDYESIILVVGKALSELSMVLGVPIERVGMDVIDSMITAHTYEKKRRGERDD